jgi:hypothetical protein
MTTSAPPSKPRKKRSVAPKHETIVRAFKFAMDVPEAKSGHLFEACATLCEVRNEITDMLAKQRSCRPTSSRRSHSGRSMTPP